MATVNLCKKEKICALSVVAVVIVVVIVLKLPAGIHRHEKTSYGKQLGYPSVLYDCVTNQTDATGAVRIPDEKILSQMNHEQLTCLYYSYVTNIQYLCRRKERMGNIEDGGWDVCIDQGLRPTKPCLVFSVGIANDFTFDDAVNRKYGCEVHSYDPSIGREDHLHAPNMYFHDTGLAAYDGKLPSGWRIRTLGSLRNESDPGRKRRTIDILKIDIERMEWEVLPEVIKSKSYLGIKQLCIEFHSCVKDIKGEPPIEYFLNYLQVLDMLYQAGFRIFWTNKNFACKFASRYGPHRTGCHEVYFIQTRGI